MGFWDLLYELNREMYSASARIDSPHHWESKHYQWITNARGVLYWAIDDKALYETRGQVYILGNPAVSWGCGLAVLAFLVLNAIRQRLRLTGSTGTTASPAASRLLHAGWFCFFAYLFNLLPYLGVTRQAFIYHYMPALMYAMLIAGCVLQWQFKQETLDRVVVPVALLVVIVTFIRYAPWIYAFPLPNEAHENRRWMSSWT
jgi:dolichyl-phosphate-mannose-protein mannosyltransferase